MHLHFTPHMSLASIHLPSMKLLLIFVAIFLLNAILSAAGSGGGGGGGGGGYGYGYGGGGGGSSGFSSNWLPAHATFYGDESAASTMG